MSTTHIYLRKANDDLISHCQCQPSDAIISSPGQMDCPWCGCGWLFVCRNCRKAFTFAEGVELDEPWEVTAVRAIGRQSPEEIAEWVEFMKILLKGVRPGERYVYLDGYVIPTTAERVSIEGSHAHHDLNFVPQVAALGDPKVCDELLASRSYWQSNRVQRDED